MNIKTKLNILKPLHMKIKHRTPMLGNKILCWPSHGAIPLSVKSSNCANPESTPRISSCVEHDIRPQKDVYVPVPELVIFLLSLSKIRITVKFKVIHPLT